MKSWVVQCEFRFIKSCAKWMLMVWSHELLSFFSWLNDSDFTIVLLSALIKNTFFSQNYGSLEWFKAWAIIRDAYEPSFPRLIHRTESCLNVLIIDSKIRWNISKILIDLDNKATFKNRIDQKWNFCIEIHS